MKLNHINLTVTDVPAAHAFLQSYFGLRPIEGSPRTEALDILQDDDGLVLTLMRAGRQTEVTWPSSFHVGFIRPSPEEVDELHRRLSDDGFEAPPPRHFHGAWTFYFQAPGGFTVEVQSFGRRGRPPDDVASGEPPLGERSAAAPEAPLEPVDVERTAEA